MTIVTAKWNLQEYHQMIETGLLDERKVELVSGEIIEMSPEGAPHSSYNQLDDWDDCLLSFSRSGDRYPAATCLDFDRANAVTNPTS
jgi:Putative restriction endonuclease